MIEEWKVLDERPVWEISNLGRIRWVKSKKLLKQHHNGGKFRRRKNGRVFPKPTYPIVISDNRLKKAGKRVPGGHRIKFIVHRLVAKYFVPNPQNKPQVNHIDSNTLNNCASNLEWVTNAKNWVHGSLFGRISNPRQAVLCLDTGVVYLHAREAAKACGCSASTVRRQINGICPPTRFVKAE